MEKKGEAKQKSFLPVNEMKYTQSLDEMKPLISHIKDQMMPCPKDDLIFNLVEKVDYYSLIRNFTLKTKSPQNNNETLNKFKDNLLTDLASLESFIVIPTINSFEVEGQPSKGNNFKAPKVFDINGDEAALGTASPNQYYLFFFDNVTDLGTFIARNRNINIMISCVGINMNFFETKKWIKSNGLLNNTHYLFYFTEINKKSINSSTNLKLCNLPRIALINNGVISEDKGIKSVNAFDLQRDFINMIEQKGQSSGDQSKIDKWLYLENDNKRKVVKSMNIYLKNNGFNDVHFYVKTKICIDKKGIKKVKCHPVFYGEANISNKNLIDNLIYILNGQQLFYEIQSKIKYNNNNSK
jgi:hypothetical protein